MNGNVYHILHDLLFGSVFSLFSLVSEIFEQTLTWKFFYISFFSGNQDNYVYKLVRVSGKILEEWQEILSYIISLILRESLTLWGADWKEKWDEVAQSCPTLCDPVDCSPPCSYVHGILQARILEWVAVSFSRGSSGPRDQTQVSRIAGRRFNLWATREARKMRWTHLKINNKDFLLLFMLLLVNGNFWKSLKLPVFEGIDKIISFSGSAIERTEYLSLLLNNEKTS